MLISMSQHSNDTRIYELQCKECNTVVTLKAYMVPGFSDYEEIECPNCNAIA